MKIITKAALLLLCMVMIFCSTVAQVPYSTVEARDIFDVESELKQYQAMLKTLQAELAVITSDIQTLEGKSGETAALMSQYLAEIDVLESEITIT